MTPIHPNRLQARETPSSFASIAMVLIGLRRPRRPNMISAIIMGTPIMPIQIR